MNIVRSAALVLVVALGVAGCASASTADRSSTTSTTGQNSSTGPATADSSTAVAADTSAEPTQPTADTRTFSNTVLPTLTPPTAPPRAPSDQLTGIWVLGTVTVGGDGPCYTFTADDGRVLALSSAAAGPLVAGDRLRVRILMAAENPPLCGDVEAWTLLETKTAV